MEPFERQEIVDKPGIVGAKWWHATLVDEAAKVARRDAIRGILIVGGVVAGFGALLGMCIKAVNEDSAPDVKDDRKAALDMQKKYGWNFGAVGEPLVFDGVSVKAFEPSALSNLAGDMRPERSDLRPYYQRTLFDSLDAMPTALTELSADDAAAFRKLKDVLKPISTPAMAAAYVRGKSLASLMVGLDAAKKKVTDAKLAVVVDLAGPEAVAFAAGAARAFDPVFLFDNWPHPRGVVRAHETLSAAVYYQPLFVKESLGARDRLPMFVLDRRRLTPYTDDASQFDNRYVAKLPWPAGLLRAAGVERVIYVVPRGADTSTELDDLNDDFVGYVKDQVDVKALALDAFAALVPTQSTSAPPLPPSAPDGGDGGKSDALLADSGFTYYGGSPLSHFSFFSDYGLGPPPRPATLHASRTPGTTYRPVPRKTAYSTGTGVAVSKPRPATFATVPVVVAVTTGAILGAKYARNGSWNRSSGGWGG
jgi:hypothetical protein